ncbi:MAG: hypothetical protein ABSD42_08295 [Candidatus Bathyarchaeia archaeon]
MEKRRTNPAFLSNDEADRGKPYIRVGVTNSFIVDFYPQDRVVVVYGREIPLSCPFKLRFSMSETKAIIPLLQKAKAAMRKKEVTRIGEGDNIIVDSDGNQRLVMVYEKTTPKGQFKLAFSEIERTAVIKLLVKARSLF